MLECNFIFIPLFPKFGASGFINQLIKNNGLISFFTVFTGWETANKYKIKNSMDQQVYFASEGKTGMLLPRLQAEPIALGY